MQYLRINILYEGEVDMSVDLDFWKYKKGIYLDNDEVYAKACCNGEIVDGLEELPIKEIIEKVSGVFNNWTALDEENYEKVGRGSFSIFTTSQIVRFDCYGMAGEDMNLLIDIMLEYDCPLFDPQISERFDGEN